MAILNREHCLCGVHVHTGSKVVAIVFLVLSGIGFVNDIVGWSRVGANASTVTFGIIGNLLGVSINVALLYGNSRQKPGYYWPFIIINVLCVCACFVVAILMLIFGGTMFDLALSLPENLPEEQRHSNDLDQFKINYNDVDYKDARKLVEAFGTTASIFIIAVSIFLMVWGVFYGYIVSIVIRGYRYLNESGNPDLYNKLSNGENKPEWT